MTDITRITGTNPIDKAYKKNTKKSSKTAELKDSVSISSSAQTEHLKSAAREAVKRSPEIRQDRVEEARKKLESGEYLSEKVAEVVADRIVESMGI